jgi:hypothetical protein
MIYRAAPWQTAWVSQAVFLVARLRAKKFATKISQRVSSCSQRDMRFKMAP